MTAIKPPAAGPASETVNLTARDFAPSGVSPLWRRWRWAVWGVALVIAVLFPFVVDRPRFWIPNIGIRTLWLGVIAMSLVFLNRYVGLLSLAQMTLAGIAAYGVGFVTVTLGWPVLVAVPVGVASGTIAGFLVALIAARTKAIYFLMITLALSQVFYSWASQAIEVTNARRGLAPIPRPDLGVLDLSNLTTFYLVSLIAAVLCYALCRYVVSTPFGMALQGIRDSPDRMRALGYSPVRYRVAAMTFAAFIASIGGVILVFDRSQVDPDVVSLGSTLDILVVAVIGGIGSLGGAFIGGLVLALLTNFAQNITDRYMTFTGLVFIAILLFAPTGIAGIGRQVRKALDRRARRDGGTRQRTSASMPTNTQSREEHSNDAED
ncbi:branched-chain amino acid ABC transporter permease [Humibacter sp. BT305]|nr:branched-chain amino acid ABC transporter permease [Humibacter sp. BT305]